MIGVVPGLKMLISTAPWMTSGTWEAVGGLKVPGGVYSYPFSYIRYGFTATCTSELPVTAFSAMGTTSRTPSSNADAPLVENVRCM